MKLAPATKQNSKPLQIQNEVPPKNTDYMTIFLMISSPSEMI